MIAGMGHGTPVAADLGTAGPFMLDVGISSTREIAAFWGVAETRGDRAPALEPQLSQTRSPSSGPPGEAPASPPTAEVQSRQKAPEPTGVQKTIEDALRSAGLMR